MACYQTDVASSLLAETRSSQSFDDACRATTRDKTRSTGASPQKIPLPSISSSEISVGRGGRNVSPAALDDVA